MIRALTEADLPHLARMRTKPNATAVEIQNTQCAVKELLPKLFLNSPWRHPGLASLVSEDSDSLPHGMISVGARPMNYQGRQITAAIGADLFVAPGSRSRMAGVGLLKTFLNGPQDITICDVANDSTRRIWERMGGHVASQYNLNWYGILRPTKFASGLLREKWLGGFGGATLLQSIAPFADRILPQRLSLNLPNADLLRGLHSEPLTAAEFGSQIGSLTAEDELAPIYCRDAAEWTWKRLPYLSPDEGTITAKNVRNSKGDLLGCYLYKMTSSSVASVLLIAAKQAHAGLVFDHLITQVWQDGASAIIGRVQPRLLQCLLDRGFSLRARSTYALVHSRDRAIADCFRHGSAWLSVLDGEALFNVWNRPQQALHDLGTLPGCFRPHAEVTTLNN